MTSNKLSAIRPTSPSERILSLDVLRGFALLGILIVNIQTFAMIFAALSNPTSFGDLHGVNYFVALFTYIFAEHKFMTLFCLLFGAGIMLMAQKIEDKGGKPAGRHYLRMMWLIIFGLLHAYLLWYGDVLTAYGICGLLVYLFRKKSPKKLFIIGMISVAIATIILILMKLSLPYWPEELLKDTMQSWKPGAEYIAKEISIYQGGWWAQMAHRVPTTIMFQTLVFISLTFWRAAGLMLIGMALFKWGILSATRSNTFYRKSITFGLAVGIPIVSLGWLDNFHHNWSFDYSMFFGLQYNYWGSLFLSFAYIGGIMLLCRSEKFATIKQRLAAVGRMAFTNYLLQTIICTIIFYGHGFGLFGKVNRIGQIAVAFSIFAFQLWISPLWLKYYRFGPIEWLWRWLTYRIHLSLVVKGKKIEES